MLLSPRKPVDAAIHAFLEAQRGASFSYPRPGCTRSAGADFAPPAGFRLDHHRVRLGSGAEAWARARAALAAWRMFPHGWVTLCWPAAPLKTGSTVAVRVRVAGLWSLNACRIAWTIDEEGPVARFGFAYGTLPAHAEAGEERFLVEWNRADDAVCYDLLAVSRPSHPLARLAFPLARRLQRRFAAESLRAMARACAAP